MNITDIAKLAGVGVSTVSRALNNYPDVSAETKQRVLDIVKKYNYHPNDNAKNLKQIATNNINIIVKGKGNLYYEGILEQMQHELACRGFRALVTYIDELSNEIQEAVRLNQEKKPEGVIFLGGTAKRFANELKDFSVPCVVSSGYVLFPQNSTKGCVCIDDKAAAYSAVEYLIEQGHTNIAILGGKLGTGGGTELRYHGAMECMRKHGIKFDQSRYLVSKFSLLDGYKAMCSMLVPGNRVTAVFAMADVMAIGAAKAITDAGLCVPDDISIIGFDGIDMSYFYNPSLATIKQPAKEIATKSVEMLVDKINGDLLKPNIAVLGTQLVKGNSVKQIVSF
ncbi:LacI family DNA-binding transcriptional regulator [Caproicibacter sp.]|uniref:LacI family DNA-binding transcriptional regulator n=1 Tax=Caproicibacter sp. TaxID=2814884 RepID=UPI00398A41FE